MTKKRNVAIVVLIMIRKRAAAPRTMPRVGVDCCGGTEAAAGSVVTELASSHDAPHEGQKFAPEDGRAVPHCEQ